MEAHIRRLIQDSVYPLVVSSGTIHGLHGDHQIDGIVWDRHLGMPLLEVGDVAIIPPVAVKGIFEVKFSVASIGDLGARLEEFVAQFSVMMDELSPKITIPKTLGIVISDPAAYVDVHAQANGRVVTLFRGGVEDGNFNVQGWSRLLWFIYRQILGVNAPWE